ncbi:MAG: carotenoid 1,2-hydratase [Deltaproteobacteria bacterium]|nr:carotenoid 1,2-hydratase [Deltaproteobacteria bacterium]MBW2051366.1 carotenoid 1,2-hydratase [Deltaproteobacteria bacterium]MBW2139991.1 carotenoid 1,2-hydratase [Deltaproteobacteria bacterium]MBW2322659.1 carotenoid 1,2-hydratase [Deltaproteobacteria bacterium]
MRRHPNSWPVFFFFILFLNPAILADSVYADEYLKVTGPCRFQFPRDHGAHPGYLVEWWYYTGNLSDPAGKRYGFQLTFFRTQISPPGLESRWPDPASAWRTTQLFLAHAAISDLDASRFYFDQQMARGALGLAGAEQQGDDTRIFLGTWSALIKSGKHFLKARADNFEINFTLVPAKPLVAHGNEGHSLKGIKPESASCYYSFTRLETSGTLKIKGKPVKVRGTAWMDHEFSTAPLEPDVTGWDWFSLQLENNTELMIYLLRTSQGGYSSASSGTFVLPSARTRHLSVKDIQADILDHWKSPHTNGVYPSRWRIQIHPLKLDLILEPNLADQELITPETTQVNYWEGSVSVKGKIADKEIKGVGYIEMTGYANPFNLLK